jgi:hypothetical protein
MNNKSNLFMDASKILILEGPDRVGKSSFVQEYREHNHYSKLVVDRLFISNIVYRYLKMITLGYSETYIKSTYERELAEVIKIIENFPVEVEHLFLTAPKYYIDNIAEKTNHKYVTQLEIDLFEHTAKRLSDCKNSVCSMIDISNFKSTSDVVQAYIISGIITGRDR